MVRLRFGYKSWYLPKTSQPDLVRCRAVTVDYEYRAEMKTKRVNCP
ncbi:hypothetical protein [Lentzea tibetensis]|nr:hypothetical protein [Lentzea tibetensis]